MSITNNAQALPMDMHNVFRLCPKDSDPTEPRYTSCKVDRMMATLIRDLTRQRPMWKFYGTGWGNLSASGSHYWITRFEVEEDGEPLGDIGLTTTARGGRSYQIKNRRIYLAMHKAARDGRITNDLKKATKTVLQNFYLPTLAEVSSTARNDVSNIVTNLSGKAYRALSNDVENLRPQLIEFVGQNWQRFAAMPLDIKLARYRDNLLDDYERAKAMEEINQARTTNRGTTVLIRGERYLLSEPGTGDLCPGVPPEGVPDHIKAGVGMLKLVDNETAIPGVGVRIKSNLFFILNPKETN